MAALNLKSLIQPHVEPQQAISHDELVGEHRREAAFGKAMELKANDTPLTEDDRERADTHQEAVKRVE